MRASLTEASREGESEESPGRLPYARHSERRRRVGCESEESPGKIKCTVLFKGIFRSRVPPHSHRSRDGSRRSMIVIRNGAGVGCGLRSPKRLAKVRVKNPLAAFLMPVILNGGGVWEVGVKNPLER